MVGECQYQLGAMPEALAQYEAALKLYLLHSNWMLTVDFPPSLSASSAGPPARSTWGTSRRTITFAQFPDRYLSFQGRIDNSTVLRTGGVVRPAEFHPVRAQEVARCIALSLRRRREIMGPACPISPLTTQLVTVLEAKPAPPNHWSQAWVEAQLGLTYASAGKNPQAIAALKSSLLAAKTYEHPLSSTSLLELGKLALIERNYEAAANFFLEATYSAAMFGRFDVMEEAFRHGLITHLVTAEKGPYPPLANAAVWAHAQGSPPLEASLQLLVAENYAALSQAGPAGSALRAAQGIVSKREMSTGQIGARAQFQSAQVAYLEGKLATGDAALAAALRQKRLASLRLNQTALVDTLYTSGVLPPRQASDLFAEVLREPLASDWALDPFESLAVATGPNMAAHEHWFLHELMERKDNAKALEIADLIRRKRFFTSLPDGGRLLALRWILSAPSEALTDAAEIQRNDLLARYPALRELAAAAQAARTALALLPLSPEKEAEQTEQLKQFKELAAASSAMEGILRTVSLQRQASDFVFPPMRTTKDVQAALADDQLALVFFAASREVYAFAVSSKTIDMWRVQDPAAARATTADLLKSLGLRDRNQPITKTNLEDETWKGHATKLLAQLTGDRTGKVWEPYEEVVIVPDAMLWYVPFETLLVPTDSGPRPLITQLRIRYAPTMSLAVPDDRGHRKGPRTAVFPGRLFPRDGDDAALDAFEQIAAVVPGTAQLASPLPVPSGLFATICDRLIVLDDIDETGDVYDWSPMQIDRGRPGSALGNWLVLPWGGPESVLLPGYHTVAETALRDSGDGRELFFPLCALMSTGTRTVLISRWRTAGRSSHELVREFAQELSHAPAASALQRSVGLLMHTELAPDGEPRVQVPPLETPPRMEHPFFWAGYLVADGGSDPRKLASAAAAPPPDAPVPAASVPTAPVPTAPVPTAPVPAVAPPADPATPASPSPESPAAVIPVEKPPASVIIPSEPPTGTSVPRVVPRP
jgi:hypothetical protein